MRTVRLANGDIQVTMSEAEALGVRRDIQDGDLNWLDRIEDGLNDLLEPEEDDDDEDFDDDEEDDNFEGLDEDDVEEISS